jgi:hypothetical protein
VLHSQLNRIALLYLVKSLEYVILYLPSLRPDVPLVLLLPIPLRRHLSVHLYLLADKVLLFDHHPRLSLSAFLLFRFRFYLLPSIQHFVLQLY